MVGLLNSKNFSEYVILKIVLKIWLTRERNKNINLFHEVIFNADT